MNAMGIIFANDDVTNELTIKRTMASLPFGGRYRQVDFQLANLTAGGVRHLGIVSRSNYQSLMNHIGSGEEWGLEMGEGGLEFLTPGALGNDDRYRGKLENLHAVLDFLADAEEDYVVLSDSSILTNLDVAGLVASHVASGKDITIVAKPGVADGAKVLDLALKVADGAVSDIVVNYAAEADYLASMDIFVVGRKWLIEKVEALVARDKFHMDRDLVLGQWNAGTLTIGSVTLDDRTKSVLVDGEQVALTPTEYSILHLLMSNPGRVYSTKALYEAVWQETALGSEGAVAVHIRHLREKIEINPSEPRYLKVVWGQGYKIEQEGRR